MSALQFCHYGGIELVDERCNTAGVCGKQSVRLAWDRGSGVLFEGGDSTGEKEQRRIGTPELERLLADITGLDAPVTDADVPAGTWRVHERAMTVSTNCSDSLSTFTFLGAKPAWERVRDAQADCAGPLVNRARELRRADRLAGRLRDAPRNPLRHRLPSPARRGQRGLNLCYRCTRLLDGRWHGQLHTDARSALR